MEHLEKYIKPRTYCADRSPFSNKNIRKYLSKNGIKKYAIPLEELNEYKAISALIPIDDISIYNKINKEFLHSNSLFSFIISYYFFSKNFKFWMDLYFNLSV